METYKTVRIGNRVWLAENLRDTSMVVGGSIPLVSSDQEWINKATSFEPARCFVNNSENSSKAAGPDDYEPIWTDYDRQDSPGGDNEEEEDEDEDEEDEDYDNYHDHEGGVGDLLGDGGFRDYNTRRSLPHGNYGSLYNHFALVYPDGSGDRISRNFTGHPTLPDQTGWRIPYESYDYLPWTQFILANISIEKGIGHSLKSLTPSHIYISGRRGEKSVEDADWFNYNGFNGGGKDQWNFRLLPAGIRHFFKLPDNVHIVKFIYLGRHGIFWYRDIAASYHASSFITANYSNTVALYNGYLRGSGLSVRLVRDAVAGDPPTGEFCQDYVGNL